MIFAKCALFFIGLLSISTAELVANDGKWQRRFNASPRLSVEKRVDSEEPAPVEYNSSPHEVQPDLQPGALYIRVNSDAENDLKMVPVIYLGQAVDEDLRPIIGQVNTVELVLERNMKNLERVGDTILPERYFGDSKFGVLGTSLHEYRVKLGVEPVAKSSFQEIPLGWVTTKGWELLKADVRIYQHRSGEPQTGFLYILEKKAKIRVEIPVICLGPVPDKHGVPIPGQFYTVELVKTKKMHFKQRHHRYRLGDMRSVSSYFGLENPQVLETTLSEFRVKLSLRKINELDLDKTPLAEVTPEGLQLLLDDRANLYRHIRGWGSSSTDASTGETES